MPVSRLDKNRTLSKEEWVITLIRIKRHAELILEGIDQTTDEYVCKMIHLLGTGSSREYYSNIGYGSGVIPSYTSKPTVAEVDLTKKRIRYDARSTTWPISSEKVHKIFTLSLKPAEFSLFGRHAFFNIMKQMVGFQPADSCVTWAINILLHVGVKINIDGNGFNLLTFTGNYTQENVNIEKNFNVNELCKFAKEGDTDAIESFFPKNFNVNQITQNACVGPVESFLGLYSPLCLAVAYNQLEVVKLLIEKHNADIAQCVGRRKDYTALDCAKHNFWFVKEKCSDEIKEYISNLSPI